MNKKFSTLVAGLLLAGGAFSSAYAEKLSAVADNGKFYKLEEAGFIDRTTNPTATTWISDERARGWFIDFDEATGQTLVRTTTDNYWKVVRTEGGYIIKDLFGHQVSVGENGIFTFNEPSSLPVNSSQLKQGSIYIGYKLLEGSDYILSDQTNNYCAAWDAQETSLKELHRTYSELTNGATYRIVVSGDDADETITEMLKVSYNSTSKICSFKLNSDDSQFKIGEEVDFVAVPVANGYVLRLPSERGYVKYDAGRLMLADNLENASILGFVPTSPVQQVTVGTLNYYEKDGFSVEIYYDTENHTALHEDHLSTGISGNVFVGHLQTMKWNGSKFVEAANGDNNFWLKNEAGKFIVAVPYDVQTAFTSESLYNFIAVDETTLTHNLNRVKAGLEDQKYFGAFAAYVDEAAFEVDQTNLDEITWLRVNINAVTDNTTSYATLGHANISQVPTLLAAEDYGYGLVNQFTSLYPIYISLNAGQVVSKYDLVKAKFYTVEKLDSDGKSVGHLVAKTNRTAWEDSYGNDLEGQFALVVDEINQTYKFTNRENPSAVWASININRLYTTDKADTYKYAGDIYVIKTVDNTTDADGYKRYSDSELNRTYNIAFSSNVFGNNAYFVENHEDGDLAHVIGLETASDNALVFNMKKYNAARNLRDEQADHTYKYHPSDSVYVISTLNYYDSKKNPQKVLDTLKVVTYSFVNQWNEPLMFTGGTYDKAKNTYYSKVYADPENKVKYASAAAAHEDAQKFAVRYDANSESKYNLRPVSLSKIEFTEQQFRNGDKTTKDLYQEFENNFSKVYAGDAAEGILANIGLYNRTENDLFVIEETEKEVYRSLAAANENGTQTISIYREGAEKTLLFENGEFLGLANIAEFPKMAPAMLADTAYVRNETYKPQYLLVVNPTIVPNGTYCPIHGTEPCEHATETKGWVEGRYLVNLVDSAAAWDAAHKHQAGNPYKNTEGLYKLGFVQATHKKDSLIIASDDKQIFLGNNKNVNGKYAFRYVDTAAKSFTIETTLDGSNTPGYLKWMNGVVVAVADVKNADVFNLNEDEDRTPTANEAVAAEVSVVAVKGAIIVKGAAGKVVTVANILGQTIANQVAASDNVTIAAPAGIAVVTVDGEATKVVVK